MVKYIAVSTLFLFSILAGGNLFAHDTGTCEVRYNETVSCDIHTMEIDSLGGVCEVCINSTATSLTYQKTPKQLTISCKEKYPIYFHLYPALGEANGVLKLCTTSAKTIQTKDGKSCTGTLIDVGFDTEGNIIYCKKRA